MEYRIYIINLYDIYSSLLTKKQQEYFEDYYFSNLTLSEISENMNISRNGIYKQIKEAENKLKFYEEQLQIYKRNSKIKKILENIDDDIKNQIIELL